MKLLSCRAAFASRTEVGAWETTVCDEGGDESENYDVDIGVLAELQQVASLCVGCLAVVSSDIVLATGLENVVGACW